MEHFVTLFNRLFLPQGLALHMSMKRHVGEYILWILCVDDETFHLLARLSLANVRLLRLAELETPDLLCIKPSRTIGEYCWTLTPFAPRFVFNADASVQRVTYIDADLWFLKDPKPIFDEFDSAGKEVLITDHAYAPEYDQSATSGKYCVQFMIFTQHGGEPVRKWWEERCLEWCFARSENGKFGDQKYLDDWPKKFGSSVHVLQAKEQALAPWNATRFPYGDAVFYHFHGLRLVTERKVQIGNYFLPNTLLVNVYQPYLSDISKSLSVLSKCGFPFTQQTEPQRLGARIFSWLRRLGAYYRSLLISSEYRF